MFKDIKDTIDFKRVRTIISKEESDLEEWKFCNCIPFKFLDKESIYSINYIALENNTGRGYGIKGTPDNLLKRLTDKIENTKETFLSITDKDGKQEFWYIVRD